VPLEPYHGWVEPHGDEEREQHQRKDFPGIEDGAGDEEGNGNPERACEPEEEGRSPIEGTSRPTEISRLLPSCLVVQITVFERGEIWGTGRHS
jgi:hypothetical protein